MLKNNIYYDILNEKEYIGKSGEIQRRKAKGVKVKLII